VKPAIGVQVQPVTLQLTATSELWQDIELMQRLDEIMRRHEGTSPLCLLVPNAGSLKRLRSRSRRVEWSDALAAELSALIGQQSVTLVGAA
jgi:hypothetical protein